MKEIWKDVVGYEGYYKVSNLGNVSSVKKKNKILMLNSHRAGYPQLTLSKHNIRKTKCVHRLLAKAFIPNPLNKKTVNHINGIKTDNRVENLEWATYKENMCHAHKIGIKTAKNLFKPVLMLSLDDEPLLWFESQSEAKRVTKIKNIHQCCIGRRKYAGGYKWEFYKESV